MSSQIVVIGEALIDLIQRDDGTFEAKPGGAPANVSIALARLGTSVRFAGRMSTDKFGEKLHDWLSAEPIDLSLVEQTDDATSLAIATLDGSGKAGYSFYITNTADWGWQPGSFDALVAAPPAALVIGSVAMAKEPGCSVIESLAATLHALESTTVIFDVNVRPGLGFDHTAEVSRIERQIGSAHIVKASDDDLIWLYPGRPAEETARQWADEGHYVILTLGSAGASLFTPSGEVVTVSAPSIELVDSVGAGDSFLGATLFGLQHRNALGAKTLDRLHSVSPEDWHEVLELAAQVGAMTCQRAGCNPPTAAELGLPQMIRLR